MANFRSIYKVQVFLTILIHLTLALYEDQVGKFDWKRSFVGKVKFVSFEATRIIVATEENVLASLNIKTGEIQWRQILEDPGSSQIELLRVGKEILTVSGGVVRTWEVTTGSILNEWPLASERTVPGSISVSDGKLYHTIPIPGSHLEFTIYRKGSTKGVFNKISAPWIGTECVCANSYYVCLAGTLLHYVNLDDLTNLSFSSVDVKNFHSATLIPCNQDVPSVLLRYGNEAKLVEFFEEGLTFKPYSVMPNAVVSRRDRKKVVYQLEASDNKDKPILVKVKDYNNGAEVFSVSLDYPVGVGAPIILHGSEKEVLLTTTDHVLLLFNLEDGKVVWSREEALSSMLAVEFFELPISELDASIEQEFDPNGSVLSMFINRVTTQSNQLYNLLFGNQLMKNSGMVRDKFGLHQIIVTATRAGKLFALDTLTGGIIWSYRLPNVQPFLRLNGEEKLLLLVQRTAQYVPLPAQCVLLAQDALTGNGVIFQFDPITGYSSKGVERLGYKIAQATLLPNLDKNYLKPVLVISDLNQAYLYPQVEMTGQHYIFTANPNDSNLKGFSVNLSDLVVTPTWEVSLQPSKIVEVSSKKSQERVHSQGKVLHDRSVFYKYINPNLIAVATVTPDQIHRSVVSVYLIDGVTGLVLHSTAHKKARAPIHLVHSENWLVYSYFNDRFRRFELTAVELYEGLIQSNSTVFSSFAVNQLPDIQTQSYILPAVPTKMAVTLTERGITNKFLLIALSSGSVLEIPWLLLQPRFPGMPCGLEESCIPYMPEIPLHSEAIINYNQTLSRIRDIAIAPARLESTSHILIHGLDVFYTRVAPSKTFDLLKEDFDYHLIGLVLVGLIAATFITKSLAARKTLKQAWK